MQGDAYEEFRSCCSQAQLQALNDLWEKTHYPSEEEFEELASKLQLRKELIKVWPACLFSIPNPVPSSLSDFRTHAYHFIFVFFVLAFGLMESHLLRKGTRFPVKPFDLSENHDASSVAW